ncbi:MAG: DNA N-6-adenine-methyltransferase [Candidatus Acidiferrales bacterium]
MAYSALAMTAGRKIVGKSKDWGTPKRYVDAVRECFGGSIGLDPCSNRFSIVHAKVEYSLPEHDGLRESWNFPTVYVNPPYGLDREHGRTIKDWLRKCEEAFRVYSAEVIALVPVATNTGHWKKYIYGKAIAICFLYDTRLRFLENGKDSGKGAPMSCAMVYWGKNLDRFSNVFMPFGAVVSLENLKDVIIGHAHSKDKEQHRLEFSESPQEFLSHVARA